MDTSRTLLDTGDTQFRARDYAQATETFQAAAQAALEDGDDVTRCEACAMAARGYLIRDLKEPGREWLAKAAELATPDAPRGWSRYLGVRGRFEWKDDDLAQATDTFRDMYDYCLQHGLHERAVDAAHMVAITGTADEQEQWAHKGIAAAEAGGLDRWLGPLWNNLAVTCDEQHRYEEALDAYLKARHYHWKVGDEQAKLLADWAVGKTYRRLRQYETALQWLRPTLAWSERLYAEQPRPECGEWVGLCCWDLGEIAAARDDRQAALEDLQRARTLLEAVQMSDWDPQGWQELTRRLADLSVEG